MGTRFSWVGGFASAALLAVGLTLGAAPPALAQNAADSCLVEVQQDAAAIPSNELCRTSIGKNCTFQLRLCLNQADGTCTAGDIKKKVRAKGHCGPVGKLQVTPNGDAAVCGAEAPIVVRAKKNGTREGRCNISVVARTSDGRKDKEQLTLVCKPSGDECAGGTTTTQPSVTTTSTTVTSTTTTSLPSSCGNSFIDPGEDCDPPGSSCTAAFTGICQGDCTCPSGSTTCPPNPAGGPRQLDYTIGATGTDLDTGFSGVSHNFPVIEGAKLSLCLTECDTSTNPVCKASGPTGQGSLNGATFGPPLPLFAANVPVCTVSRFRDPAVQGTVNIQTGEYQSMVDGNPTPIALLVDIYLTSVTHICPKCSGGSIGAEGTCDSGTRQGQSCTVTGQVRVIDPSANINELYRLSDQCPPGGSQGSKSGTLEILLPLTTGTDSRTGLCPGQQRDDQCGTTATCSVNCEGAADVKGGINQWCCSDTNHTPCFPTAANSGEPNHAISRVGMAVAPTPLWPDPTYPKTGDGTKTAATFCIGDTGSSTVDVVAGLPGPGAIILNGRQEWLPNE